MQILLFSLGFLVFIAVIVDIVQTTLSLQGGGWITTRFSSWLWRITLSITGKNGKSSLLSHVGYVLIILIVFIWVILLWLSFFLILSSTENSVLNGTTKLSAGVLEKLYYAGFTISTLGVGDYQGSNDFWRIITNIYSFTGLIFLTMSVTYLLPALSAVMDQRKLGISISSLGSNPQDIILNSWNGKNFDRLFSRSITIANDLILHSQHHWAYPVIQFFQNNEIEQSNILQLARLHEALYILEHCVRQEIRPADFQLAIFSVAFENYIHVLKEVSRNKIEKDVSPEMHLDKLTDEGLVLPSVQASEVKEIKEKRNIFYALVKSDGWDWQDVYL